VVIVAQITSEESIRAAVGEAEGSVQQLRTGSAEDSVGSGLVSCVTNKLKASVDWGLIEIY